MFSWRQPIATLVFLLVADCCAAQPADDKPRSAARGPLAILVRNPDRANGAPPYALADQYGHIQRLVEESPRVDLSRYVGQRVRIEHDTGHTLLASQLDLPSASIGVNPVVLREVSPAQFVPPRSASRLRPGGRQYSVRPAQGQEDLFGGLSESGENLPDPGPSPTPAEVNDAEPIMLDDWPAADRVPTIEPIPNGSRYFEELPALRQPDAIRAADCPHCNSPQGSATPGLPAAPCKDCEGAATSSVDYCQSCGKTDGWCGPTCNPPSQPGVYGRAEYLLWWFAPIDSPPLATTNDQGADPLLGADGTTVVYGGNLLDESRNGLRLTLGAWLDSQRDFALEGDWILTETESSTFFANDPAGLEIYGRPFYNVAPVDPDTLVVGDPIEDVLVSSFTGQTGGVLAIYARSEFESLGLRLRTGICCRGVGGGGSCQPGGLLGASGSRPQAISRVDFFTGYRYAKLDETLGFHSETRVLTGVDVGDTVEINEAFTTDNDFHGVDLGFVYDWQSTRWGLELTSRLAIGGTTQRVLINGSNIDSDIGAAPVTGTGGLYTQSSNIGSYKRDRFSVLPELSARLSYRVTPRLSLSAAYTVIYWANVARPGDQIDYSVDERQILDGTFVATGNTHPRFDWEETALWAHGFNFGLDYQY